MWLRYLSMLKLMFNDRNVMKKVISMDVLVEFRYPHKEFYWVLPAMAAMEVGLRLKQEQEWIFNFQR